MHLEGRFALPPLPSESLLLGRTGHVAPRLCIKLLGTMAASDHLGRPVLPRGRKARAILGVLALAAPQSVLREQLTGLLWSRREREQARGSLRQALHELAQCLQPAGADLLLCERSHLRLLPAALWVDVHALSGATASDPEPLSLLVGRLMEDLNGLDPGFDHWLAQERRAVQSRAVALAEAVLAGQTEPAGNIAAAERLLSIEPSHEGAWRSLIEAQLARGEAAVAIHAYERCAAALAEAGTVPSAATRALVAPLRERTPSPRVDRADRSPPREQGIRLGVLPFRSLGPGVADELSFALAEEITATLARFRWISLIPSTALAALSGESMAASPAWRTLDVDAVLEGTVQRGGRRVRVIVRLLDMRAAGEVIWSRRFDRPADDILTVQDDIAAETAAQVDPELLLREGRRAASRPPRDARAYDLLVRAIADMYRFGESTFRAAGETLAAAAALDPNYAPVHAWWAYWHVFLVGQGWAEDAHSAMRRAGELADRAITLDPSDARALSIAGHVRAFLHRDLAAAIQLHEQALSLNPHLPMAWALSGMAQSYAGHHEDAIRRIRKAQALSPFDPHAFIFDMALMIPHLALGEYETVVRLAQRATALNPTLSSTQKGYLSALGHLGRTDEAAVVRERLLALEPGFCVGQALLRCPLLQEADRLRYAEGLRRAGLPE